MKLHVQSTDPQVALDRSRQLVYHCITRLEESLSEAHSGISDLAEARLFSNNRASVLSPSVDRARARVSTCERRARRRLTNVSIHAERLASALEDVHNNIDERDGTRLRVLTRELLRAAGQSLPREADIVQVRSATNAIRATTQTLAIKNVTSHETLRKPPKTKLSGIAVKMAGYAVLIIPLNYRARYDEEYRGDLTEIAEESGRFAQIFYAIRVFTNSWRLRQALRDAAAEKID